MRGEREQELSAGGSFRGCGDQLSVTGSAPTPKGTDGRTLQDDDTVVPSRASTSLEHWESQSAYKAAQSSAASFEEDDYRGLSRAFRLSIMLGSALIMLAVILCLVLFLPHSSHKTPKHDNSSKVMLFQKIDHAHFSVPRSELLVSAQHTLHQHSHHAAQPKRKFGDMLAVAPLIASACKATRFPDACQTSLTADPSANSATSVMAVVDAAVGIARTEVMSLHPLSEDLLRGSSNINLTTAARDCAYLLGRSASFLGKCQATPFAAQMPWQVADAQAWMSAALTYENDCRSALSYVNISKAVDDLMGQLTYAINLTSNVLSMVDAYQAFGDDTSVWTPPTRLSAYEAVAPPSSGVGIGARGWWQKAAAVVANDGTGDYSSVQEAVNAAPEGSVEWFTIHVKAGIYMETVKIPSTKTKLAFVGDGMGKTIITGSRNAQMPGVTTYDSATVAVDGDGFVAVGITFENTAGPEKHQAVALRVDSDFAAFYNCSFLGHQDTLYVHSLRQFYKGCRIEGTIDFVFGNAAAVFQDCEVLIRPGLVSAGMSVVAAQGRTDPAETCAIVFDKCSFNGTTDFLQRTTPKQHRSYLGRPWKAFSRTILLECVLAGFFEAQGWLPWNGDFALDTLFYGEYLSSGPGANPSGRVPWSMQLSPGMARLFTIAPLIQGDRWLPATSVPFSLSL